MWQIIIRTRSHAQAPKHTHIHTRTHHTLLYSSTLTHCCTAWALTGKVTRMINGFNSRCLHVITGQDYHDRATTPVYDLVLAVRQRRMRYLGHVLRMPPDRIVRRALVALVKGGTCYPEGSLFDDCGVASLRELVDTAKDRSAWRATVNSSHLLVPHPIVLSTIEMNFHLIMFVYVSRKEEVVVRTPKCCVGFELDGTVGSYSCLRTTISD